MSTGLNCFFQEVKPNKWYYILQDWPCPCGAWDWREYATAYGPFATLDIAQNHLRANHANPGGSSIYEFENGFEPDDVLLQLIKDCQK